MVENKCGASLNELKSSNVWMQFNENQRKREWLQKQEKKEPHQANH